MGKSHTPWIVRLAPMIFVFLWATGFIGAKYGMTGAEPFTFLGVRFASVFLLLAPVVFLLFKNELGKSLQLFHSFLAGCLIHGIYLGGVFYAIDEGLAAGLSSLVVSLQPFCTVLFGFVLLGERVSITKLAFFLIALVGVVLVMFPDLDLNQSLPGVTPLNILACVVGMIAISLGAVYQKRFVTDLNILVSTFCQFAGATIVVGILALILETNRIDWTIEVTLAMVWSVLVLSIGAVGLLMVLIRQGSSSSVASLFYLVPVVAMVMAWVLFDERLVFMQMIGSALVVASVAFASRAK